MDDTVKSIARPAATRSLHDAVRKARVEEAYQLDETADRRDSEIALGMAQAHENGEKRFPLPIKIDPLALTREPRLNYLAQQNQYDVDFLLTRARARGCRPPTVARSCKCESRWACCRWRSVVGPTEKNHTARKHVSIG